MYLYKKNFQMTQRLDMYAKELAEFTKRGNEQK